MDYKIIPECTITLNLRLRGGAIDDRKTNPSGNDIGNSKTKTPETHQKKKSAGLSFKDILEGNKPATTSTKQAGIVSTPYIVEKLSYTPELNMETPEIDEYYSSSEKQALICRFNCFWPKSMDLFLWVFRTWTNLCDIHLCSKGFFIVKFRTAEERDIIMREGPWFMGSTGFFISPWFPEFDPNTMVVSRMPVWVHLHNLPLHFWSPQVLSGIGNTIR